MRGFRIDLQRLEAGDFLQTLLQVGHIPSAKRGLLPVAFGLCYHQVRRRIDVDEDRQGEQVEDGLHRCDEGVARDQDLVAWPNVQHSLATRNRSTAGVP